jgi:threonine synthase
MDAYQRVAREEGIFCEPASAASVAGLLKLAASQDLSGRTCVCVITGAGLKDPDTAKTLDANEIEVPPRLEAIESALAVR